MGNSQSAQESQKESPFIRAIKLQQELPEDSPSYDDLTNQIEQVFGISSIPVSHRADIADSIARSVGFSVKSDGLMKGKKYEERISNLESQIIYLKSLIEESKYRSRNGSPVRSEANNQQSSSQIQQSFSRLSRTYFQSRSDEDSSNQSHE